MKLRYIWIVCQLLKENSSSLRYDAIPIATHTNNDTKIYIFIHFNSIKYIPHWGSLRAMEFNHICCGISKFSNRTLYSLQVRPANYRLQINSVFVHRKELRLLLIEYPRASCKIPIPSLILPFITGFSFISEFYHILASKYKN